MTALTEDTGRSPRAGYGVLTRLGGPVAASNKILQGSLVVVDKDGNFAVAAAGAAKAGTVAGVCNVKTVDNSSGAAGAKTVEVECGCFKLANSSTSALAAADFGQVCYAEDDNTVRKLNDAASTYPVAGTVVEVESDGVWVMVNPSLTAPIMKCLTLRLQSSQTAIKPAALTVTVDMGTLPKGAIVHAVSVDVATPFAGTSITAVSAQVGTATEADSIVSAADILSAATADGHASTLTLGKATRGVYDNAAIKVKLTATGANLSALSAGDATIKLFYT